jgi:hypothetical protein
LRAECAGSRWTADDLRTTPFPCRVSWPNTESW